jgi:adenylylsulfate kinase
MNRHQPQSGFTFWLTGIPRSGKSTLAFELHKRLIGAGRLAEILDGDEVRARFSCELGFQPKDRELNVRRIGYLAELLNRNGIHAIVAAISPYREGRDANRLLLPHFLEIYCHCTLDAAERRDYLGLYEKARRGELKNLTGFDAPYEAPLAPDLILNTDCEPLDASARELWEFAQKHLDAEALLGMQGDGTRTFPSAIPSLQRP